MPYEITNSCISCGACEPECPFEVITQGPDIYVIDADLCTDCGACEAVCPVGAIRRIQ
jgi:ferredoxin